MSLRLGLDIGGTFTDLVAFDANSGEIATGKALTTPHSLAHGVLECVAQAQINLRDTRLIVHGTTVGVNALIERKGAKTALLTTGGFRDVLEIGRGNYGRMFDLTYVREASLVPRRLRFEVPERLSASGEVIIPLDEDAVARAADAMRLQGVTSVAVVFLFSYLSSEHERRAEEIIRRRLPGVSTTASHRITQEWREYERTSTTVINAYVQPIMESYLSTLEDELRKRGFGGDLLVAGSNGGALSVASALAQPVHTLESGPAAGAVGCASFGGELSQGQLIAFDMGGTTAKCCLVEQGRVPLTDEYTVDGQIVRIPVVDIKEVSAGGGTIARVDSGGALSLGPQSAGAAPGPACYGLGGDKPTVTDANLVTGRIGSSAFLGGRMALQRTLAERAFEEHLARPLGLSVLESAVGVLRLANVKMALAVRGVTTARGLDPRDYTLVAYGGSGPLHAAAIAREVPVRRVAIPPLPSTFSAWGMLTTDLRHDLVRTVAVSLSETHQEWVGSRFAEMAEELAKAQPSSAQVTLSYALDMRYAGQVHSLSVPLERPQQWHGQREAFDAMHRRLYGFCAPDREVELTNLRLTAIQPVEKSKPSGLPAGVGTPRSCASRDVYSLQARRMLPTPVFRRESLGAGHRIEGPAVIEENTTTTILDGGDVLHLDTGGFLVIDIAR